MHWAVLTSPFVVEFACLSQELLLKLDWAGLQPTQSNAVHSAADRSLGCQTDPKLCIWKAILYRKQPVQCGWRPAADRPHQIISAAAVTCSFPASNSQQCLQIQEACCAGGQSGWCGQADGHHHRYTGQALWEPPTAHVYQMRDPSEADPVDKRCFTNILTHKFSSVIQSTHPNPLLLCKPACRCNWAGGQQAGSKACIPGQQGPRGHTQCQQRQIKAAVPRPRVLQLITDCRCGEGV